MPKRRSKDTLQYQLEEFIDEQLTKHDGGITMDEIRTKAREHFPKDFWVRWSQEALDTNLGWRINNRINYIRTRTRKASAAHAVSRAAKGEVDDDTISIFQLRYHLGGGDPASYTLGSLRGSDHLILSEYYATKGEKNLLYSDLHARIARKVGNKRTDEVYTEDELMKLFGKYEYDPEAEARKVA